MNKIEVLAIYMLEDGFQIEAHPLVTTPDGEFVRERLIDMLPVIVKQLKNPYDAHKVKNSKGDEYGVLWPIQNLQEPNRKPN